MWRIMNIMNSLPNDSPAFSTKASLRFVFVFLIWVVTCGPTLAQQKNLDADHATKMAAGLDLFKKEVKPILVGRCLKCHGGEDIEGEFDLSNRKAFLAGGSSGEEIKIGQAESSLLYKMIAHETEPTMPEDGAKLDQRHIDAIAKWINLGAPYDKPLSGKPVDPLAWTRTKIDPDTRSFWSFQPLKKVKPPELKGDNWSQSELDPFILRRLREKNLTPNKPLERTQLARRLYLSVIGLPPSPEQLAEFEKDQSPQAIKNLIDRLLESKHFGEKWARHWLDVARFGESHGFEQDYDRPHAYHFRDFVIKAFNSDLPYNQFIQWQLAGDELKPNEPLALMATGFLGAGVFPTQLTEKEFESARYDELDDMAATVGTAMLGLTIGCARCHDHKFDPIPQRDYYQFVSTFTTTIRSEVELELDKESIRGQLTEWQAEHQLLQKSVKDYEASQLEAAFAKWLDRTTQKRKSQVENGAAKPVTSTWVILDFIKAVSSGGATLTRQADGSLLATGKNPDFDSYEFVARTHLPGVKAIRIEALAHDSLVRKGPGRASNGNFALGMLTVSARQVGTDKKVPIKLVKSRATFQQNNNNLSVASSVDNNLKTGWAVDPQFGKDHTAIFEFEKPLDWEGETELVFQMNFDVNNQHSIGRPRISITNSAAEVDFQDSAQQQQIVELYHLLQNTEQQPTEKQKAQLFRWFRTTDKRWQELEAKVQKHLAQKPRPVKTKVMISSEGVKPLKHHADGRNFPHFYKETFFLKRGDANQKQGAAKQAFPQILTRSQSKDWTVEPTQYAGQSFRRATMANWITDVEDGPGQQLARVMVNRIWQQYFGQGIVATPNDFGFQGARPTHPELLDWLAQKLIDNRWSLKSIHRLILNSATYQQSSQFDSAKSKIDPTNELLWRYSPRRLQAELIRDSMLSVSQTLDATMFGKGTLDERMKRRSIYFMIKRSRLIPMMQIFDSPEPLVSVGSRPSTTIAPQALMFMNNPNVRSYSQNFAKSIMRSVAEDSPERLKLLIRAGFKAALARQPTELELQKNLAFIKTQKSSYEAEKKRDALELAVTDFCQILFCLNEFIYVD